MERRRSYDGLHSTHFRSRLASYKSFHWIHVYVNDAINIVKLCMSPCLDVECCAAAVAKATATSNDFINLKIIKKVHTPMLLPHVIYSEMKWMYTSKFLSVVRTVCAWDKDGERYELILHFWCKHIQTKTYTNIFWVKNTQFSIFLLSLCSVLLRLCHPDKRFVVVILKMPTNTVIFHRISFAFGCHMMITLFASAEATTMKKKTIALTQIRSPLRHQLCRC